jgi:hypothetical protein
MKIRKIIFISGVAVTGYKIYNFFKQEENLIWMQDFSSNAQNVNEKYQQFNKKLENLKVQSKEKVQPAILTLTREVSEYSYLLDFKIKNLSGHIQKISEIIQK